MSDIGPDGAVRITVMAFRHTSDGWTSHDSFCVYELVEENLDLLIQNERCLLIPVDNFQKSQTKKISRSLHLERRLFNIARFRCRKSAIRTKSDVFSFRVLNRDTDRVSWVRTLIWETWNFFCFSSVRYLNAAILKKSLSDSKDHNFFLL